VTVGEQDALVAVSVTEYVPAAGNLWLFTFCPVSLNAPDQTQVQPDDPFETDPLKSTLCWLAFFGVAVKDTVGQVGGGVAVGPLPFTVMVAVAVSLWPRLSVIVRTTLKVPAVGYVLVATTVDPPKLQL